MIPDIGTAPYHWLGSAYNEESGMEYELYEDDNGTLIAGSCHNAVGHMRYEYVSAAEWGAILDS